VEHLLQFLHSYVLLHSGNNLDEGSEKQVNALELHVMHTDAHLFEKVL